MQSRIRSGAIALVAIITSLILFIILSTYAPNGETISTSNNSTNDGFPFPAPPDIPIEYIYGLKANLTTTAAQWKVDQGTPLLQPTWVPAGMKQTAVYMQNNNVTTHTGIITTVTTLYSFKGIDDPWTAEVQLRVQMYWSMFEMVPRPGVKIGEGNYTVINGNPGYVGVIGWGNGSYYNLYGGDARVVIVQYGDVLYFFRAPMSFSSSDLMKMANSLKPV